MSLKEEILRLTKKQKIEIDFFRKFFNVNPTTKEIIKYFDMVSGGGEKNEKNILFQAKRRLDMTIKMWRQDLVDGLLLYKELKEDFNHPYASKVIGSLMSGIMKDKNSNSNTGFYSKSKKDL